MSYAPTIAYCNMFSIFYLEIISITKLVSGKTKSDSYLGMAVNVVISGFYFLLFLAISFFQYGADQINNQSNIQPAIEIFFLKNWYSMQTPFYDGINGPITQFRKTSLTLFDINMVILVCILFIHCLMNLFIAKESALIYADEVYNKSLSKLLDKKREGTGLTKDESKDREGFENEIHRLAYLNLE